MKNLLEQYNLSPNKALGQHFLCDESVLLDILSTANLQQSDFVLEVGPGLGALTLALAQSVAHVLAVEQDPELISILKKRLKSDNVTNVSIVSGDVLQQNLDDLLQQHRFPSTYRIVANLPYQISSRFFRNVLALQSLPTSMTVLVQKEVAERATAKAGQMSMLSVLIQSHSRAQMGSIVPPESFCPPPAVNSAILHMDIHADWQFTSPKDSFFRVAKIGFAARRKQLLNNIAAGMNISKTEATKNLLRANIDPSRRAQTLELEEWDQLTMSLLGDNGDGSKGTQ